MKIVSFDIEISNVFDLRPGDDIDQHAPFDVAVAATQVHGGEHRLWFSPGPAGRPLVNPERQHARELLEYLEGLQRTGHAVCAWNGLSFDLQWLARAADAGTAGVEPGTARTARGAGRGVAAAGGMRLPRAGRVGDRLPPGRGIAAQRRLLHAHRRLERLTAAGKTAIFSGPPIPAGQEYPLGAPRAPV